MLKISDIMTRDVFTLAPSASLEEAAAALAARGISGAPVRDDGGRLVGVVSRTDLTDPERRPWDGRPRAVRDIMTPGLLILRDSDLAMNAIRLMVREEGHRIIVLDDEDDLVGIVTPRDVLHALTHGDPLEEDPPEHASAAGPVTIH
jgi:CBS domain-containing membrane protein